MSLVDWLIIGCFSVTGIGLVLMFIFVFSLVQLNRKKNILTKKRPKNKKKRRQWKRQLGKISKKQKQKTIQLVLLLLFTLLSLSGGIYSRYYQSMHLNAEDKEIISQSYFILNDVEKELKNIQSGADLEKTQEKMKDMLSTLVSYTSRQPSNTLSVEGQQELRSYYKKATEFGTNLYSQTTDQLSDEKRIEGFLTDISSLKKKQTQIFENFGINEGTTRNE